MTRPTHLKHPGMPNHTLCGYTAGIGCRFAADGEPVTCTSCRAVVSWCRDSVRIGVLPQEHPR